MPLLVTGGAGFIGSHLIERVLARSAADRIVCVDDFNNFYDPAIKRANVARFASDPRITVVEHSFGDQPAMRRLLAGHEIRHIVHLGGYAGVRASLADPALYEQHNVRGTAALLDAACQNGRVERFVFVSSSTVYGQGAAVPFVEDAPLGTPLSPYGATKRAAELLTLEHREKHGLGVVILRPFSVYGPRTRPDLAMYAFAAAIAAGRPVTLWGDGSIRRDFTHVSDVCDGILAALTAEGALGQAINLGHHQPASILELLDLLEKAIGRKAQIDQRLASPGDMPLTCADLTKARRLLGYAPRIALPDGVREFVAWFLHERTNR